MKDLTRAERQIVSELRHRINAQFPDWNVRITVFGSRARGSAEPDSDMDVLLEIDTERVSFPQKRALRRIAGELSIKTGVILSLLIVDQDIRRERGDFSIFQTIRDEGIPA